MSVLFHLSFQIVPPTVLLRRLTSWKRARLRLTAWSQFAREWIVSCAPSSPSLSSALATSFSKSADTLTASSKIRSRVAGFLESSKRVLQSLQSATTWFRFTTSLPSFVRASVPLLTRTHLIAAFAASAHDQQHRHSSHRCQRHLLAPAIARTASLMASPVDSKARPSSSTSSSKFSSNRRTLTSYDSSSASSSAALPVFSSPFEERPSSSSSSSPYSTHEPRESSDDESDSNVSTASDKDARTGKIPLNETHLQFQINFELRRFNVSLLPSAPSEFLPKRVSMFSSSAGLSSSSSSSSKHHHHHEKKHSGGASHASASKTRKRAQVSFSLRCDKVLTLLTY